MGKNMHVHRNQHCRTLFQHTAPGFYKKQKIRACAKKFFRNGIPHCIILSFTAEQLASVAFSEIKVQKQSFADVTQNKCSQKQTPTQVFSCKICEILNMWNTFFSQKTSGGCLLRKRENFFSSDSVKFVNKHG